MLGKLDGCCRKMHKINSKKTKGFNLTLKTPEENTDSTGKGFLNRTPIVQKMIKRVAKWNEKDSAQQPKQSVVTVRRSTKWEKNISASYFNDRELTSRIDREFF